MITVIQRVTQANVEVNQTIIGRINQGILALVAVEKTDQKKEADKMLEKILNYRIFADENDKMNLSLRTIQGGLLLIPQFTLAADTQSGNRPSFSKGAPPEQGQQIFNYLRERSQIIYPGSQFGEFGADMKVSLINDGPVTFTLRISDY
jgi:D-tyrosyl-tRNA(Tyr) deacylase